MYYFDKTIERYESTYCFSDSLAYLIKLYENLKTVDLLNSIIAFSWYYLIEGPVDSGRFENEDTSFSLETWKKYVEYVIGNGNCEPSTLYFCGYTLSLHGFLIGKDMEFIGKNSHV